MHEETPVESVFELCTLDQVFEEIDSILRTGDPEEIVHALGFVRDASLFQNPTRDSFRKQLDTSTFWETLAMLLRTSNFWVRKNAIYTFGKLTNRQRAYLLADAFPFFLEKDPINLPSLLMELLWLTNEWNWSFVERVAASKHYLVRWSLCTVLDDSGYTPETLSRVLSILSRLKSDSHPLIVAEATLRFERVNVKLGPKLPKAEWRKEEKRIANLEPKLMFEHVAMEFMRQRTDYSLDDFDRFVAGLH